jgi:adenylate cyclase
VLSMLAVLLGCIAGAAIVAFQAVLRSSWRRWMARHPAPTFVFADLVGYTELTETVGDEAAAHVAKEFSRALAALCRQHGAWQVKSMGDGAMIWAPDASAAVTLAARALEEVGTRPDLLPIRVGAQTGPAVMHRGDWYGRAVNLAARLAREATPNEALVSDATRSATRGEVEFSSQARRELMLQGVEQPVVAWRIAVGAPTVMGTC